MAEVKDTELITLLREAFVANPVRPDDACLAKLHATLSELTADVAPIDFASARRRRAVRHADRSWRRATSRSTVLAAAAFAVALTAGVAAAAVATNTLPGPLRGMAYDLGLPVTSPALEQARQVAVQLQQSLRAKNVPEEQKLGVVLIGDLRGLNMSDLAQIRTLADHLLTQIGLTLPKSPRRDLGVTVPSVTTPTFSVPGVTIPGLTIPGLQLPSITTPGLKTTSGALPIVATPTVTIPPVVTPTITTPTVVTPTVTIPPVTIPTVTIPTVTIPTVTLPPVTLHGRAEVRSTSPSATSGIAWSSVVASLGFNLTL